MDALHAELKEIKALLGAPGPAEARPALAAAQEPLPDSEPDPEPGPAGSTPALE